MTAAALDVSPAVEAVYRALDWVHAELVRTKGHKLDKTGECVTCRAACAAMPSRAELEGGEWEWEPA